MLFLLYMKAAQAEAVKNDVTVPLRYHPASSESLVNQTGKALLLHPEIPISMNAEQGIHAIERTPNGSPPWRRSAA